MNTNVSQPGNARSGNALIGFVFLAAGLLLLLSKMGYDIPDWIFTWPSFLICLGIIAGIRRPFPSTTSIILIAIGLLFLARHQGWIPVSVRVLFWPGVLIIVGLLIIFRPKSSSVKTFKYSSFQDVTNEQSSDEQKSNE